LGEEKYKKLVNFILKYIADLDLPKKRLIEKERKRKEKEKALFVSLIIT